MLVSTWWRDHQFWIIADASAPASWVAMDLFSQAEHDEQAQAILISWDGAYLDEVEAAIEELLGTMEREAIIRAALANRGALIKVEDLDSAITLSNRLAPEHLELAFEGAEQRVSELTVAGAIFVGLPSCEALGDYCAGPIMCCPPRRPPGSRHHWERPTISRNAARSFTAPHQVLQHWERLRLCWRGGSRLRPTPAARSCASVVAKTNPGSAADYRLQLNQLLTPLNFYGDRFARSQASDLMHGNAPVVDRAAIDTADNVADGQASPGGRAVLGQARNHQGLPL